MKYYTGLDVSMETTAICTLDQEGTIVFEDEIPTDPKLINMCLKAHGYPIDRIALESGSLSHFLVKELANLGRKVICIDARSLSPLLALTINKTDRNDARGIAEAIRCNCKNLKSVYHKSKSSMEMGTFLATRRSLINQRTDIINSVRGLLKTYGIRLGAIGKKSLVETVRSRIAGEQKIVKTSLEAFLVVFEKLDAEIGLLDKHLVSFAKDDIVVNRLMTVPGIGPITALSFKIEIDDPARFKRSRSVGAFLGMTPTQYSSGQTKRQGRISKCGSSEVRAMLAEAALVLLTRYKQPCLIKEWGLKIVEKHGYKKATVALGRKLAVTMHRMWADGKDFNPEPSKKVEIIKV